MKCFVMGSAAWLAASVLLQAQFGVPRLGVARFGDGSVHIVQGLAANFIVQSKALGSADSVSFSSSAGLTASKGVIRLLAADGTLLGEYESQDESPVLNVDAGAQTATVWLPSLHLLLRWNGARFIETVVDDSAFGGKVSAVSAVSQTSAKFFVTRTDSSVAQVSVLLPAGRVTNVEIQPGARGWTLAKQGWILSYDPHGLTAEQANGNRQTIALGSQTLAPGDLTVEPMADHWLHVSSRLQRTNWAIYLDATKVISYLLPPPASTEGVQ